MTSPSKPSVVVEAGSFTCKDSGKRKLAGLSASGTKIRLTVAKSPVVTVDGAGGPGTYTGCTVTDSNSAPQPCKSTTIGSTGAGKLTVGGKAVLLSNDKVSTVNVVPTGSGTATVDAGQTKLTAT